MIIIQIANFQSCRTGLFLGDQQHAATVTEKKTSVNNSAAGAQTASAIPSKARTFEELVAIASQATGTNIATTKTISEELASVRSGGMVSKNRKEATALLSLAAIASGVPGDFVECGTYTGGTAVIMLEALKRYLKRNPGRVVDFWGADSFQGLPPPVESDQQNVLVEANQERMDNVVSGIVGKGGAFRTSKEALMENLKKNKVYEPDHPAAGTTVHILEGWFIDTLPSADIKSISFLRLDGDLYVSTIQPLEILWDKLSVGGFIYVDDYGSFQGCRNAVNEFRKKRNITTPMVQIEERDDKFEAVWWQKE